MPEELPEDVTVSQPNLGCGTVASVRLSAEEHRQLQQAAQEANLPISTLIRLWVLDRLRGEQSGEQKGTGGTIVERLARLELAVFRRTA